MKYALGAWGLLLSLAVGYLLWKDLSVAQPGDRQPEQSPEPSPHGSIAVIYIDSLEKHYALFTSKKEELEKKQRQAEALLDKKITELENDYVAAQQAAPTMSAAQLQETQNRLQKKQLEVQELQRKLEADFQQQIVAFNQQLQDSLASFLEFLNADGRYALILTRMTGGDVVYARPEMDITQQVIEGLNRRLTK